MEIKCEKSYGSPAYSGVVVVTTTEKTRKDIIKYRFRMAKLWVKRLFGLLK